MKFITYNDSPGGVYKSQVTDVCLFLQNTFAVRVELIAFVSLRTYYKDRKIIKKMYSDSTVLPVFPGINNWRKNLLTLKLFMLFRKRDKAISRGVFATILALNSGKFSKLCFDARTAYAAEWKEYLSSQSPGLAAAMPELEKEALLQADFKIAVSEKLVNYWKETYGYDKNNHVVIPCTISSSSGLQSPMQIMTGSISELRNRLGVTDKDILLVFSGSSAGWQSIETLYQILKPAFIENASLKLLLLSRGNAENGFSKLFPGRVIQRWVEPENVSSYLNSADYGLLYREESVTNSISSPVKFAEYLTAGLPVIISRYLGDYSLFVKDKKCGLLFDSVDWNSLERPSAEKKERIHQIALAHLTKSAYTEEYKKVIA